MTALVLTLDCASGHSFRTRFCDAKQANVVLSSCPCPSVLLICLSVWPCGELDSETQLATNPVKELKKKGLSIFLIQLRSTSSSAALQKVTMAQLRSHPWSEQLEINGINRWSWRGEERERLMLPLMPRATSAETQPQSSQFVLSLEVC